MALTTLKGGRPLVTDLVPPEVGIGGEFHGALCANMTPPILVLGLVCAQLAGVGKPTSTEAAAVWLDVTMLQHMALEVAGLCEGLLAHSTLMWPCALVRKQMCLQVAWLLEQFSTVQALMWLDPTVTQDVCNQIVL